MWCCANKLTINPTITNIVIIASKRNKAPLSQLSLTTNGSQINIVDFAKHLGVFIDQDLDFKEIKNIIKVLESKVARAVGILTKLKHVFPSNTMMQLYHALVHLLLSYGIII